MTDPVESSPRPRALLVKFGAIGDVAMLIPAAFELHAEGYHVDWACGATAAPLLACYPWIHRLVVDEKALITGGTIARLRAVAAFWRLVLPRRYAVCAVLYYDVRYRLLTAPVRTDRMVRLSRSDRRFRLIPGRHHASEYARLLGAKADDEEPASSRPLAPSQLPASPHPRDGRRRVTLVPGGAHNLMRVDSLRRWPVECYVALAERLIAEIDTEVILVGGPTDAWVVPHFAHLAVNAYCGQLSLPETMALLDDSDVVVSHDTGPLHLAGLGRAGIVSIFGPTDPHVFAPRRPGVVALWGGATFACRPCYDGSDFAACNHNGCIRKITPEHVLEQVRRLLAGRADSPYAVFDVA